MALTAATQKQLYQFFSIAFDAVPGVTYMGQLTEAVNAGMSVLQIVEVFTTKVQFTSVYPEFYTNKQFASKLIENVVGDSASSSAKAEAIADVEAALGAGWSRGKVIYQIFSNLAAKNPADPVWGDTAQMMANKVEVAKYVTETQLFDTTDMGRLQAVIADVTADTNVSTPAAIQYLVAGVVGQGFTVSANAPTVVEGESGVKNMVFELTLAQTPLDPVTLNFKTLATGSATSGEDFVDVAGTVTFAAGQSVVTVSVPVAGDVKFEGDETIRLEVSGAKLAATVVGTGTILNDDVANRAPVATNITVSGHEDAAITGTVFAADADGDAVAYSLVTGPANGTLVLDANGSYTYTPNANFNGTDSFTYKANDGTVDGNTATVTLTVAAVNDAPVAQGVVAQGAEDAAAIAVTPVAADIDAGDTLTYSVNSQPSNGTVSFNAVTGKFDYVPNANFNGTDSFTYKVTDAAGATSVATASVTVTAVNDAPVAANAAATGFEDSVLEGSVKATDVEGSALTYSVVSGPAHGTLVLDANGSYTYTPNANFNGTDSFTYKANDGELDSNEATVAITVKDVVDVLTANQDLITLANTGAAEVVRGANHNLGQGDVITGGAEDSLVLSIDEGSDDFDWYYVDPQNDFASFSINGVGTFQVTNDDTDVFHRPANFDMSSSEGVQTLVSENSKYDVRFNYANLNDDGEGGQFVNLQARNLTDGVNVTLDVRNGDVTGENDTVNLLVTDSDDDSLDAASINITAAGTGLVDQDADAGIEVVNLNTGASTGEVRINDLNTPGAHTLNIATDEGLVIGDSDAGFGVENALSGTVLTVDAEGSEGDITLSTEASNAGATITGGNGDDTFFTSEAHGDEVRSGEGNDSVYAGSGDNFVDAGAGFDLVITGEDNDTIYGQEGNDTIQAGNGNNDVWGGDGYDQITVGYGSDYVNGGNDDDTINAGAGGNDTLLGGNGNDEFNLGSSLTSAYTETSGHWEDQVDGGEGFDTLNLTGDSGDANELDSVQNVEQINLTGGSFYIEVNDGSWFDTDTDTDTVIDARFIGGTLNFQGNDGGVGFGDHGVDLGAFDDGVLSRDITILGGNNNDTIVTGVGFDSIRGGNGDDTIRSGAENDTIDGAVGEDNIDMQAGDDLLIVQNGELDGDDQLIAGGSGTDTIELVNPSKGLPGTPVNVTAFLGNEVSGIQLLDVVDNENTWNNNTVTVTVGGAGDNYDNLEPGDTTRTVLAIDGSELDAGESLVVDTRALDTDADGIDEDFNITGGAGNDTFRSGDNLDSGDTFEGGVGSDRILATGNTGGDDDFANVSSVEIYEFDIAHAATLAANAQAAGILTVTGSTGNDTLDAGAYTVGLTVNGNAGEDNLTTGSGNDTINAGAGSDTVVAGEGNDLVINDTLELVADNVSLGGGNDTLRVYGDGTTNTFGPFDTVAGGAGTDTVELVNSLGAVTAFVNLNNVTSVERYVTVDQNREPVDTAYNFAVNFSSLGNVVNTMNYIEVDARSLTDDDGDTLTVDLSGLSDKDFSFTIRGGAHNDTVIGDNGLPENLVFFGGAGNDRLEIGAADVGGSVTSDGGEGTDTLAVNDSSLLNPVSDDTFVTLQSYEVLTVATGDNSLFARLGDAAEAAGLLTVIGGTGNDNVLLDPAFDPVALTVDLSAGGNDTINAGASTTAVTFEADAADIDLLDVVTGGSLAGDEFMLTADEAESTALVGNVTGVETFTLLENGDYDIGLTVTDNTFTGVTGGVITVDASDLDDLGLELPEGDLTLNAGTVTGTNRFDVTGGTGNDTITTGAGNDTIAAGEGNDSVTSGLGDDRIVAGNGNNTVAAGDGNNSVTAGTGNDTISSGTGNDTISSGNGNDSITSGAGNDSVTAGNGNVTAVLGDGNDTFVSGSGDSTVTGGNGADSLTGGTGADDFVYALSTDSNGNLVTPNRDTINGFESGVDDIIVLDGALGAGVIGVNFAGNGADFADVQGAITETAGDNLADYVFQADNHRLWIDVNDDGVLNGQDIQITLAGVTTIAAGDVVHVGP